MWAVVTAGRILVVGWQTFAMSWRFVWAGPTYRGWAWFIVGGALLMPYLMAIEVLAVLFVGGRGFGNALILAQLPVYAASLPLVAVTALVLPVRFANVMLARTLLGAELASPGPARMTAGPRLRHAAWFTLHLGVGALLAGATLALVPMALLSLISPLLPAHFIWAPGYLEDLAVWLPPLLGVVSLVLLVAVIALVTALSRHVAVLMLGPTAAERVALARRDARQAAARNRIARELHDSIGHALSTITVQSAAAGRVLADDPGFARRAMTAVEDTARRALEDLDAVLGILRADDADGPAHTLDELPELLRASGVEVTSHIDTAIAGVPAMISREAYRIVQESLTNVLRHGAAPIATVHLDCEQGWLRLEVSNSVVADHTAGSGGRGLTGMAERAAVLGGELDTVQRDGQWVVRARLPLGSSGESAPSAGR